MSNSKKIIRNVFFVVFSLMLSMTISIISESTKSDAAIKYCQSYTEKAPEIYFSDDGGCDVKDWNAFSMKVVASSKTEPEVHSGTVSGLNTYYKTKVNAFNSNASFSISDTTKYYLIYVNKGK